MLLTLQFIEPFSLQFWYINCAINRDKVIFCRPRSGSVKLKKAPAKGLSGAENRGVTRTKSVTKSNSLRRKPSKKKTQQVSLHASFSKSFIKDKTIFTVFSEIWLHCVQQSNNVHDLAKIALILTRAPLPTAARGNKYRVYKRDRIVTVKLLVVKSRPQAETWDL